LAEAGIGKQRADRVADALTHSGAGDSSSFAVHGGERSKDIFEAVQLDYALASRTVFYVMAGVMAVAFVIALIGLPAGKVERPTE
jgi:hypothetical protein